MIGTHHLYLTHPQVTIDPAVPVPLWGLSAVGRARMERLAGEGWIRRFGRIVSADETKALEAAAILAAALGCQVEQRGGLHENDRSATGFLPPPEFEATADRFFADPDRSIRGWERAVDAQQRIVTGVRAIIGEHPDLPTIFVGHGGVGTLLRCALRGIAISRKEDQGPGGGGCHFAFALEPVSVFYPWRPLEIPPA
ncbi:MAG TPA: histidine phosphatase family protein [Beijerinckiaceae bacterium]|nr:histidine phosphatase family protein [Beijerinckiaceae bacterium]